MKNIISKTIGGFFARRALKKAGKDGGQDMLGLAQGMLAKMSESEKQKLVEMGSKQFGPQFSEMLKQITKK